MKPMLQASLLLLACATLAAPAEEARLLRFPSICGEQIAFVYAGDIWTVAAGGGEARRLTSHPGRELFPVLSPDGRWIAFSAEYSGNRQVYVMPAGGGEPRQLTWYNDTGEMPPRGGFDYVVLDWTPDSRRILVRGNRTPWGERMGRYYLVALDGGLETPLPIPEAGGGTFSPDGRSICYTPIEREFRTWKRYQGGRAQDVWIYDLQANRSRRLTDFPGTDQHPIWYGNRICFVSDRDLTLNLYAYDLESGRTEALTRHTEYDVLWPSGRNGRIVYENGGRIWLLDLGTGRNGPVPVTLRFDNPNRLPAVRNVAEFVTGFDLSPSAKRAVFAARGDLFTVPEKEGATVNLDRSPDSRELHPAWSPDGAWLAYYSDASGEYEVYRRPAGGGAAEALTRDSRCWRFPAQWSPDSRCLLYGDKNQQLQVLDIASRRVTLVDRSRRNDITDYGWSPDSRWVVYGKEGENGLDAIWAYSLDQGKAFPLTDGRFADFNPVFSRCGKYLYFLSNRTFRLDFSAFEFSYIYTRATRIYALALARDAAPLFPFKNDAEEPKQASPSEAKSDRARDKGGKTDAGGKPTVRIDLDGLSGRVTVLPVEAGAIRGLTAVDGGVLYSRDGDLRRCLIADRKDESILKGVGEWTLAGGGKKLLYHAGKTWGIVELKPEQKAGDGALAMGDVTLRIDPPREWQQIFNDGWRIFRDWFYVKNLHGVDWDAMRRRYGQLVPHLGHRADLDFIFGEMVGEINAGHTYVNWGDFPRVPRMENGLLGAELQPDETAGRYRIARIYSGENWRDEARSPLTEPGVDVRAGDLLLRLDGHEVTLKDNPYRFLENTADKRVEMVVAAAPGASERASWIRPVKSELALLYLDWVESRRRLVDRLSGGRIGYIHVPDTAAEGNQELFKGFYAQHHKEALIIDDRYNGGGFIPWLMADLLARRPFNNWVRRGLEMGVYPEMVHDGPQAMLINGYSSSGGDAFPYYFRKKKLGPLIGTRTWGGLIGISGNPAFVDGGSFNVPTFGFVDTEGNWAVEGRGVAPDIEVVDLPELVAAGRDPSIEKAVEVLLAELEKNPRRKPAQPAEPDRSRWIEAGAR